MDPDGREDAPVFSGLGDAFKHFWEGNNKARDEIIDTTVDTFTSVEGFQEGLDKAGYIVDGADLLNAVIYIVQGDKTNAAISAFSSMGLIGNIKSALKPVNPLLETPKMGKHHIFPQQFKDKFEALGIDIHSFTISIPQNTTHLKGVHGKGFNNMPGGWNEQWEVFFNTTPNPTAKDAYQFAGKLLDQYGLNNITIITYH